MEVLQVSTRQPSLRAPVCLPKFREKKFILDDETQDRRGETKAVDNQKIMIAQ